MRESNEGRKKMVDKTLLYNGPGYYDPTAYDAISKICTKKDGGIKLSKGGIYEIGYPNGETKYAAILATHVRYATILVMSENDKLPYKVSCEGVKYTDPGMIQYAYNDRFKTFVGSMEEDEFDNLFNAVIGKLGYEPTKSKTENELGIEAETSPIEYARDGRFMVPKTAKLETDLLKVQAERDIYKSLYQELVYKLMSK